MFVHKSNLLSAFVLLNELIDTMNLRDVYEELLKRESFTSDERMEYLLNKRRGVYFDCTSEKLSINSSIVTDKDLFADIKATAKRYM